MIFGFSPFATDSFGTAQASVSVVAEGAANATASSTAAATGVQVAPSSAVATSAGAAIAHSAGYDAQGAHSDGRSVAAAIGATKNDVHWDSVVFLSHCDRSYSTTSLIDEKGHSVSHAAGSSVNQSSISIGKGCLSNTGGACTVLASGAEFSGFRLTDAWTLETRFLYNLTFYIYSGDPVERPLGVRLYNNGDNTACIYVAGQGSIAGYRTANFDWGNTAVYRSLVIESDGTTLRVILNGVSLALTPVTEYFSLNPWSGRIVLSYGTYDEIRFTKASRYAGNVPVYPWPFFDDKEKWSGKASASGVASVGAVARETDPELSAVATAQGASTATAVGARMYAVAPAYFRLESRALASGVYSNSALQEPEAVAANAVVSASSTAVAVNRSLRIKSGNGRATADSTTAAIGASESSLISAVASSSAFGTALSRGAIIAQARLSTGGGSAASAHPRRIAQSKGITTASAICRAVSPRVYYDTIIAVAKANRMEVRSAQRRLHVVR